ncbi:MAG: hypothetical protein ABEH38_04605, partial [Flavobacteriales bacterium]
MDELVEDQIRNNKNILLPKVGAFINAGGKIIFNEHLKYNDGTLAARLSEEKGIDKEEANEEIEAFGQQVIDRLEKNGEYALGSLGRLVKSSEGKISFEGAEAAAESKEKSSSAAAAGDSPTPEKEEKGKG